MASPERSCGWCCRGQRRHRSRTAGGRYQGHEALTEQRGGQHLRAHPGRDPLEGAGVQGQGEPGAVAVGVDRGDPADDDSAQLHIGALVHLVADAAGLDMHGRGSR